MNQLFKASYGLSRTLRRRLTKNLGLAIALPEFPRGGRYKISPIVHAGARLRWQATAYVEIAELGDGWWLVSGGDPTTTLPRARLTDLDQLDGLVAGAYNIVYVVRDVFADGFGGEAGSKDACLLFKILHCEEPVRLLAEAARVVRPGGTVLVIH
jgi:SAM-dependent methyltransferase